MHAGHAYSTKLIKAQEYDKIRMLQDANLTYQNSRG